MQKTAQNIAEEGNGNLKIVRDDLSQTLEDSGFMSNLPDSSILDTSYRLRIRGVEQSPLEGQKQGLTEGVVQNPAHSIPESGQNPLPAGAGQAVNPAAESPRKDSQNPQKSTGPDVDRLAAVLRAIPSEHRADFLRALADRIEGKSADDNL